MAVIPGNIVTTEAYITNADVKDTAAITRDKIAQTPLAVFPVDFEMLRVHDAYQTVLPGTSTTDDLGLYGGTFTTSSQLVRTYDVKAVGLTTLYARFRVTLPVEYDAAETLELRFNAGMVTTVADVSCTIDLQAYKVNRAGSIGSDLCSTAAITMNSLTYANKTFTITATGLAAGDVLDCRVAVAVNDAATGTAVIAAIGAIELLADIKG